MQKVIEFIQNNWQFVVLAVVAILELVVALIRKRSKVEIYDDSATSELLDLIIKAESQFGSGHGSEKLAFVLSTFIDKHPGLKGYESIIQSIVERILKSPQRKEKIDEKKNV